MKHKKLFIPGPVEVDKEVLTAMSVPMIGHRTSEYSDLQRGVTEKLRKIMYTDNDIIISTSSGTGLLEMAIRNCTEKRAIVFSVGAFGNRWYQIAQSNGVPADKHEVEWGNPVNAETIDKYLSTGNYDLATVTHNETSTGLMNNLEELSSVFKKYPDVVWCIDTVSSLGGVKIEVDKLGVDVCVSSSQKALGLPPGISIASVSEKAVERAKKVKNRGYYFDMLLLLKYIRERNFQYPSTPSISHMFALDFQLDRILKEGLDERFNRHREMAEFVRAWARRYFAIFPIEEYASNTVTCIRNTRGVSVKDLNNELGKRGFQISNGYGNLKEKTFRIAHMAEMRVSDLNELLENMEDILKL